MISDVSNIKEPDFSKVKKQWTEKTCPPYNLLLTITLVWKDKDYTQMLFDKYGIVLLETKQVSEITGRSIHSLESDRRAGEGIPFKRLGNAINSPVRYPIGEVSRWVNKN